MRRIGATPVRNSGRGLKKGDGIRWPFLIDVKEYTNSWAVSRSAIAKLQKDCSTHAERLEPMFHVALADGGKLNPPIRVWVVSEAMGLQMLEAWEEKYGEA